MTQLDDEILEVLQSSQLVLSPSIIAFNLDRTREGVAKRLSTLTDHDLVEKVERGKYRITEDGTDYLEGNLDVEDLQPDN